MTDIIGTRTSEKQAYVDRYIEALDRLDFVDAVYADLNDGLTIFTVYHGEFFDVAPRLIRAEAETIDRFPYGPIDFQLLKSSLGAALPFPATAQRVFSRP